MGIVQTKILSVGELISIPTLIIPEYQRPYKWTQVHISQLLGDIKQFMGPGSYRIGTVVIHQEANKWNIVDGQQRCLTFLLIAKAVQKLRGDNLIDKTLQTWLSQQQWFKTSFSNAISLHNLRQNNHEIERFINKVPEGWIQFFFQNCEVTVLVIDDESEAFQFFDSQNARGKDLEPHDLLKAFHLRELNQSEKDIGENDVQLLVERWEDIDTAQLARHFSDFLYRVRSWSRGQSARHFTKRDTPLFKGITLGSEENYPYTYTYQLLYKHLQQNGTIAGSSFPFQLDQLIINGRLFFELVLYYLNMYRNFYKQTQKIGNSSRNIIHTLDTYEGNNRTGDKNTRMLFDCALLYYIDKFGDKELDAAIEKIFIWAYSVRLEYQNLTMASVDNYVVEEQNIFRHIREALHPLQVINLTLPVIKDGYESEKTKAVRDLFIEMNYYESSRN